MSTKETINDSLHCLIRFKCHLRNAAYLMKWPDFSSETLTSKRSVSSLTSFNGVYEVINYD